MKIIDGLLAELEQEAETTRRVLERIPQAHLTWKPHPKSMSLGQLALHVATVPGNVAELAAVDTTPEPPQLRAARGGDLGRTGAIADGERCEGQAGAGRIRRCEDGRDVAAAERRQGPAGDAARRVRSSHHAEPLVPPPRPAARVPEAAQPIRAIGVRSDGRRESVRDVSGASSRCWIMPRAR